MNINAPSPMQEKTMIPVQRMIRDRTFPTTGMMYCRCCDLALELLDLACVSADEVIDDISFLSLDCSDSR